MKLYKHVSRFHFRKHVCGYREKRIRWALSLKPGDLVNDCTGFNRVVASTRPEIVNYHNGWFICDVDITLAPYGAVCPMFSCGVVPPRHRNILEEEWLSDVEYWVFGEGADSISNDEQKNQLRKRVDILKSGGHILDERGVLLPEFKM